MNQNETAPNRSERSGTSFGKESTNFWLRNVVHVSFFLKHCYNHRSKQGLKLYDFTILAAAVEAEQD